VRPDDARSMGDMRWRASPSEPEQALVCGPSFLALLEAFPRGALPPETACAIVEALVPPPDGVASLARLRFDLDDGVFRWCARPLSGLDRAFAPWRAGVIARLLGRHGPRFELLFSRRELAGPPLDLDELPWTAVVEGRQHLAGIVAAAVPQRLAEAHAQREQWFMHEGPPPSSAEPARDDMRAKAEQLFIEAEHDCLDGRVGAAHMNAKLASIYDHESPRYRRAVQSLTL
jgi:hypothetical protein